MNDSQSNSLDMFLVVNGLYLSNLAIINVVPARATAFGQLGTNITAINTRIAGQSANTTGVAQDKAALRTVLDNVTSGMFAPAKAWAISIGNNTLAAEFDYSLSTIQKIKDDTIQGFCDHRIAIVNANLPALSDFGIAVANVDQWQDALNDYVAVLETPREATNTKHLHTASLRTLFSNTRTLFKNQLDPLMLAFKTADPQLHAAYIQARIIIDRRGPSKPNVPADTISVGLFAFDELTLQPVQGVTLRVFNAPDGIIHQASTDTTGILYLSVSGYVPNLPVIISGEITTIGYETINANNELTPGHFYSFEVSLTPILTPPPPDPTPVP